MEPRQSTVEVQQALQRNGHIIKYYNYDDNSKNRRQAMAK